MSSSGHLSQTPWTGYSYIHTYIYTRIFGRASRGLDSARKQESTGRSRRKRGTGWPRVAGDWVRFLEQNLCARQVRGLSASSQPAAGHGAKSLRTGADGIQKQPEGRRRAPRGCPGGTQDRPKHVLETLRTAKKARWRHPGGNPGNESVPESSKAIFTSALDPFWTPILAPFLCRIYGFRRFFI